MHRQALFFTSPYQVELREMPLRHPGPGELLVKTLYSAISTGTELLVYRGQSPKDMLLDENISSLQGNLAYPLQYGYALVGRVEEVGHGIDQTHIGQLVFSFQPHQDYFTTSLDQVIEMPHGMDPKDAVFLPNMETAVNFLMDGRPLIGERVAVFGQGIVGLLTTALLALFPLSALLVLDRYQNRRNAALEAGATEVLDPSQSNALTLVRGERGVDLSYELSGAPEALDQAIAVTGFSGRVVIGSWYGQKRANLNLGGTFHRSRIHLLSSQVSTLAPSLRGNWTKDRRFKLAWELIRQVEPSRWITNIFPFQDAAAAYALLDSSPERTIQVIFDYSDS